MHSINTPRDFQIEAINHLAFSDDSSLIVIHRTMDGKSLWRHFMVLAVIVNKASIGDDSIKA